MITGDGNLHVYMVNVGQGDTTVIVSPGGSVIVVDVMRPAKIVRLLKDLGHRGNDRISQLVITHPHSDHFSGGNLLASEFAIAQATVAPAWHTFGMGPQTYRRLMGRFYDGGTNVTFLAGYSRWYPDSAMAAPSAAAQPHDDREVDVDAPFIEMLGPTNGLIRMLEDANIFNTNHLSIMLRVSWRRFRMIIGGDAQMENWAFFDHERMMEEKCQVLRTAHHGSSNGTQWERLDRLGPSAVIVSSDPGGGHSLPDLTSAAVFLRFDRAPNRMAVTTSDSGTIHMEVKANGSRTMRCFRDAPGQNVDLDAGAPLTRQNNPTDWAALLHHRIAAL